MNKTIPLFIVSYIYTGALTFGNEFVLGAGISTQGQSHCRKGMYPPPHMTCMDPPPHMTRIKTRAISLSTRYVLSSSYEMHVSSSSYDAYQHKGNLTVDKVCMYIHM